MVKNYARKALYMLALLVIGSASAQIKLEIELDEIKNNTNEILVLGIGKKNFYIGPDSTFDNEIKVAMVQDVPAVIAGINPRSLPRYKNKDAITIKQLDPVTKQMTTLYQLSVNAYELVIDAQKNIQVSVTLQPTGVDRTLLEWLEIFDIKHSLELDIELAFEKVNGKIVHMGDSLSIEVEKKD